jgi:hypothetical protein
MSEAYVNCNCSDDPASRDTVHHPDCPNHPSQSEYYGQDFADQIEAAKRDIYERSAKGDDRAYPDPLDIPANSFGIAEDDGPREPDPTTAMTDDELAGIEKLAKRHSRKDGGK